MCGGANRLAPGRYDRLSLHQAIDPRMTASGAGDLDQRITLLRKTAGRDAMGGESVSWLNHATVWARAEQLRGREYLALQQAQSELEVRFTIRYRGDVSPDWRVTWRGHDYEIVGEPIDVDSRR